MRCEGGMEDCASLENWEERLKERYPMLRYFTGRSFGVEIEFFGLKYSVSAGDQAVIPLQDHEPYPGRGIVAPGISTAGYGLERVFALRVSLRRLVLCAGRLHQGGRRG